MSLKAWSLTLLAFCEVAAMALWFSASAVLPSLQAEYEIGPTLASLYTSSVQTGFVAGTLLSALLGLADRLDMRHFFMASTVLAAGANAVFPREMSRRISHEGVLCRLTGSGAECFHQICTHRRP